MQATRTKLRRRTGQVLGPILPGPKAVEITPQGKVVAEIAPRPRGMTGAEFAEWLRRCPRLGPELAEEVARNMAEIRKAGCEPVD